jgi:acetyl-CoA carboxylase carboxyltransferase component
MGVQVGEGVNVLEGLAELIIKASRLRNHVSQYLVVNGEVYGQIALLAGICDFTFFINKKSVLAANSPLVITAASGKNVGKFEIGGAEGIKNAQLATFVAQDLNEVKNKIVAINGLLGERMIDCDQLNASIPALNKSADGKAILTAFDKGTAVEFGATYEEQIKCVLGRIGGITVASVIFDNADGVELTANRVRKINDFARFALCYNLPFINFVNTKGIAADMQTNDSLVIKELGTYAAILDDMTALKISVVYGKAIGLGYTMFAAKSMGYDYTYAFANAKIALFDSVQGAEIEYSDDKKVDKAKLAEKYAEENSDPVNAAKDGYIDNIIEPAFVRQYLITFLQMLAE